MDFYQTLSQYYDEIFPVEYGEMEFLKTRLQGRSRILDLGCGSGNKTEHLAGPGHQVVGLDLDPAMIAIAQAKPIPAGLSYQVGDLNCLDEYFPQASFEAVLCLGNTLPHLTEADQEQKFLPSVAALLVPGGLVAIQILNYDHIQSIGLTELPLIETSRVIFRRYYDRQEKDRLTFRTKLEIKGGESHENAIFLRPITGEELAHLMGPDFEALETYGGLDGRPFSPTGLVRLVLARKKLL